MTAPSALAAALSDRYRLDRELGQGGMATVYLAHDVKHDRDVALKVLRPELAAVLGRERFLAEIHLTARLDHPHILTLIDSGESEGFLWYVVPFIRGESLRQKLDREQQLGVDEALAIIRQVAGALDFAHRQGVIHRDIKPENILLQEGEAILADFGIALAVKEAGGNRLTETGLSLGTPQYMSPEQATAARQLDARSDIYSLGAVLYELLAGEPPHTGATPQAVIAKLMTTEAVPLRVLRSTVPVAVERAVARALNKAPADRFPSAGAFAAALTAAPRVRLPRVQNRTMARTAALSLLVAAGMYYGWRLIRKEPTIALGAVRQVTFEEGLEIEPSLSPDGRYIAYAAGWPLQIYLRQPGSRPVKLVASDTGGPQQRPRWSPDGSRILFDSNRSLFVIPALGGVPRLVAQSGWSPTWAPDGRQIAFASADTIFTADVEGSRPTRLAVVKEPSELAWSPDGRWIALTSGNPEWDGWSGGIGNIAQSHVLLIDAAHGGARALTDRSSMNVSPAWAPDSRHLLFVSNRGGGRDIYTLRINDAGSAAAPPDRLSTGLGVHSIAISSRGDRLAYSAYQARVNIWSMPIPSSGPVRMSGATQVTHGNQNIEAIAVSRDGWLYFTSDRAGNSDIYRLRLPAGEPAQFTTDPADDFSPAPSPDGAWVAFYSLRAGTRDIWIMPTTPGEAVRLTDEPGEEYWPVWSRDAMSLCYKSDHFTNIIGRTASGWGQPRLIAYREAATSGGGCVGWLSDGRRLILHREEEIVVMSPDDTAPQAIYRADADRGFPEPINPILSPDRRFLYFRTETELWRMPAEGGVPQKLVQLSRQVPRPTREEWDVDENRFYFTLSDPQSDILIADLRGLSGGASER